MHCVVSEQSAKESVTTECVLMNPEASLIAHFRPRRHGRVECHRQQRVRHPRLPRIALVHRDHHGHARKRRRRSQQR